MYLRFVEVIINGRDVKHTYYLNTRSLLTDVTLSCKLNWDNLRGDCTTFEAIRSGSRFGGHGSRPPRFGAKQTWLLYFGAHTIFGTRGMFCTKFGDHDHYHAVVGGDVNQQEGRRGFVQFFWLATTSHCHFRVRKTKVYVRLGRSSITLSWKAISCSKILVDPSVTWKS